MKDEILAKALSTDTEIIPRYDIVKPDGTKLVENAELVLKNAVTQQGTPYNKASVLTDETAAKIWPTPPEEPDVNGVLDRLSAVAVVESTEEIDQVVGDVFMASTVSGLSQPVCELVYGGGNFWGINSAGEVVKSPDGITWEKLTVPWSSYSARSIAWGADYAVVVVNASSATTFNTAYRSSDGVTWTAATLPMNFTGQSYIRFLNGKFFVYGMGIGITNQICYSTDAVSWTEAALAHSGENTGIAYGNGRYVAVNASRNVSYSDDGLNWQSGGTITAFSTNAVLGILFDGNDFIAYSSGYSVKSSDGITWGILRNWCAVSGYNGGAVFVGAGQILASSTGGGLYQCTDYYDGNTSTWTKRSSGGGIAYNEDDDIVVSTLSKTQMQYSTTKYRYIDVLYNLFGRELNTPRIQIGSYIGTGTYGSSNPIELMFEFEPKLVIIQTKAFNNSSSDYPVSGVFVRGAQYAQVLAGSRSSSNVTGSALATEWGNSYIKWYVVDPQTGSYPAAQQLNADDITAIYVAIG